MKSEILRALREADGDFVTGQALCYRTGKTRQAVWKNITQLKEYGFDIAASANQGYRLVSSPDLLYSADIESRIKKGSLCHKVESHNIINSTNTRAKQLAELGAEEGTLVVAEEQTAGKGRRGRGWNSGPGTSVYMSIVLRPQTDPAAVPGITLVSALATVKAIRHCCNVEPLIKWPNDIVLGGKKICGILTEMSSEPGYINYVVTGIGINVNNQSFAEEIKEKATSIFLGTGQKQDRAGLAACTAEYFGEYYKEFIKAGNLVPFIEEYNSVFASMDKEVKILHGMEEDANEEKTETGIARGINKDGALIVETSQGTTEYVVSGEVSARGLYGYV